MKRNVLNSPRLLELKKHRQQVFLKKFLFSLFALLVIFAFLVYISRIPSLNIEKVEIVGNKIIDTEMLKTATEKEIAGNYLWLFPKTNILIYPQNNIKEELSSQFKRLRDITFSVKEGKILEVSVTERMALYTWCGVTLPESNGGNASESKCYFLDDSGYIFDEAPYFSGEVYFKFYGLDTLNKDNPPGSYFMGENFGKIITFKKTLEQIGLKPVVFYLTGDGDAKIFLSKGTSSMGPEIIFKANSDFQKISENLQTALTTEPLQTNFKKKYSSLEYIDLRFGNKVYYKFK